MQLRYSMKVLAASGGTPLSGQLYLNCSTCVSELLHLDWFWWLKTDCGGYSLQSARNFPATAPREFEAKAQHLYVCFAMQHPQIEAQMNKFPANSRFAGNLRQRHSRPRLPAQPVALARTIRFCLFRNSADSSVACGHCLDRGRLRDSNLPIFCPMLGRQSLWGQIPVMVEVQKGVRQPLECVAIAPKRAVFNIDAGGSSPYASRMARCSSQLMGSGQAFLSRSSVSIRGWVPSMMDCTISGARKVRLIFRLM